MFNSVFDNTFDHVIRKHVIAFGSLFNNLYVQTARESGTVKTRVPLSYGPKEKFIQKIISESGITDKMHIQMALPRMGFEMGGLQYDPVRRINKLTQISTHTDGTILSSYTDSPYNFSFNLYVFSRSAEHNFQIIEQITPFFTPDFTVTMNMNDIFTKIDVPIILTNVQINEEYEGEFDNRRGIISVLNFTMKGYIYGPVKNITNEVVTDIEFDFSVNDSWHSDVGYTGDVAGNTYSHNIPGTPT